MNFSANNQNRKRPKVMPAAQAAQPLQLYIHLSFECFTRLQDHPHHRLSAFSTSGTISDIHCLLVSRRSNPGSKYDLRSTESYLQRTSFYLLCLAPDRNTEIAEFSQLNNTTILQFRIEYNSDYPVPLSHPHSNTVLLAAINLHKRLRSVNPVLFDTA